MTDCPTDQPAGQRHLLSHQRAVVFKAAVDRKQGSFVKRPRPQGVFAKWEECFAKFFCFDLKSII